MPPNLVLTIEYPSLTKRRLRSGKIVYDDALRRLDTRVRRVSRFSHDGVLVLDQVQVEAFIPRTHRGNVFANH